MNELGNILATVKPPLWGGWRGLYQMPKRTWQQENYRYGFTGQEKDDEVYGAGSEYAFEYRMLDARLGKFWSRDPLEDKYPGISPYTYCNNNPIRYIDPDGRDWYEASDGTKQFHPIVTKDTKLLPGQKYIGATHQENGANYRSDGSIMYSNESDAYSRMISQSERSGNESMAALTDKGTLVLPDYKNTSSDNHASVDISDYGYSAKNGNIVDASGTEYNTFGTAHTHVGGGGPSTHTGKGFGDLGFAAGATPYKPVYVLEMDKRGAISLIVAAPNTTNIIADFKYRTHTLPGVSINDLQNGSFNLKSYTKQNNFRKLLGQ